MWSYGKLRYDKCDENCSWLILEFGQLYLEFSPNKYIGP